MMIWATRLPATSIGVSTLRRSLGKVLVTMRSFALTENRVRYRAVGGRQGDRCKQWVLLQDVVENGLNTIETVEGNAIGDGLGHLSCKRSADRFCGAIELGQEDALGTADRDP